MKRNVIITGATGGLGKSTVEKFLTEGYHVITLVSPGKKNTIETKDNVEVYEADLTREKDVADVIRHIIDKHTTIDAALLLVGGFAMGNIADTDGVKIKEMMSVNFETTYYTARPIFLHMLNQEHGGRLVFIGSKPGLHAADGKSAIAYALSKSLIFKLAEQLNVEGKSKNVVSSVIVPSTIDTPANRRDMPKADFSTWVKPAEIAEAMAFLISEKGNVLRDPVLKVYGAA